MDYVNQVFDNGETVVLDENSFTGCTFRNAVLRYGGGTLHMADCQFIQFSMQFDGALANGLYALYQLFGTEGMLTLIRGFTEPNTAGPIEFKVDPPRRS